MTASLKFISVAPDAAGKIGILTLQRPERANALNQEMLTTVTQQLEQVRKHADCRALIITAAGKHFSAGADLEWMQASAKLSEAENRKDAGLLTAMFEAIAELPIPTIAYVRGSAYGGAVGLVACCDIAIAEDNARFCLSEVKLGLLPAVILPYLGRRMRPGQLRRHGITGRVFSAPEALDYGLIDIVTVADHGSDTLKQVVNEVLAGSPDAQRVFKKLLTDLRQADYRQSEETVLAIAGLRASASGQAGLQSFFDKKSPPWVGTISSIWG